MSLFLNILILMAFAMFARAANQNQIKWFVIFWAIIYLFIGAATASLTIASFLSVIISGFIVYFWLLFISAFSDSIFLSLMIVMIGGVGVPILNTIIAGILQTVLR